MTKTSKGFTPNPMNEPQKHSGLGILSFVISLVTGVATIALFTMAAVLESANEGGIQEESPEAVVLGTFLIIAMVACVVGFALGVAGLFQENRNKTFAVLGTILSTLTGLGSAFTVLLGLLVS